MYFNVFSYRPYINVCLQFFNTIGIDPLSAVQSELYSYLVFFNFSFFLYEENRHMKIGPVLLPLKLMENFW